MWLLVVGWLLFGLVVWWVEHLSVDSWRGKRLYFTLSIILLLLLSLCIHKGLAYHEELVWALRRCR